MMNHISLIDGDNLLCPKCGSGNLHHSSVTTFFRDCEDSDATRAVLSKRATTIDRVPCSAVPGRRDSLRITFWCEHCDEKEYVLEIEQHKGSTLIAWTDRPVS